MDNLFLNSALETPRDIYYSSEKNALDTIKLEGYFLIMTKESIETMSSVEELRNEIQHNIDDLFFNPDCSVEESKETETSEKDSKVIEKEMIDEIREWLLDIDNNPDGDQCEDKIQELMAKYNLDWHTVEAKMAEIGQEVDEEIKEYLRELDEQPDEDYYKEHRFGHAQYGLTR